MFYIRLWIWVEIIFFVVMAIDMPYSVEFSENWPWIVKLYMLVHNLSKLLVINPLTFMVEF